MGFRSSQSFSKLPLDFPDSPNVIDALRDTRVYEELVRLHEGQHNSQTPIQSFFDDIYKSKDSSCGASATCPAYDGETREVNGRKYKIYCTNAPWGTYFWLPKSKRLVEHGGILVRSLTLNSLSECEQKCYDNSYDCNGLTFYPSTGACSIIYSKDAAPYIWDNGYQKIGLIPDNSKVAFGPGAVPDCLEVELG